LNAYLPPCELRGQCQLVTAPAVEPVALATAKLHLRVTHTAEDDLITALITAARLRCESHIGRSYVTTTWDYVLDDFPRFTERNIPVRTAPDRITLPRAKVLSVTSVKYYDMSGTLTTLVEGTDYDVQLGEPGCVYPHPYNIWPTPRSQPGAVTVRFTAGYGPLATDVPKTDVAAILLLVEHLYRNRGAVTDLQNFDLPLGIAYLLGAQHWGDRP
jgi:uncharacterized phiE125 gp8 family phage protein